MARSSSASRRTGPGAARFRVLIVNDHQLVRHALRTLLESQPDLEVCGEADGEAAALLEVQRLRPDVAVVGLILRDGSGLDLIKSIKHHCPETRTLVCGVHSERLYGERVLRAGARGYIGKYDPPATILEAVRRVLDGRLHFSEQLTERVLERVGRGREPAETSPDEALSDRELDVFRLMGQGLSTVEVADRLQLTRSTIDTYRERIKIKLNIESSTELVFQAFQWSGEQDAEGDGGPNGRQDEPLNAQQSGDRNRKRNGHQARRRNGHRSRKETGRRS